MQVKAVAEGGYAIELIRAGSPAHKSELHAGDRVKAIAGKAIDSMKPSEIESLLEGKVGSTVEIVYLRDGKDRTVTLTFNPTVAAKSEAALLPDGVLYLRLPGFSEEHYSALEKAITDLARQENFSFDYIVFDLRNNPGGLVDVAVKVVELFLERGKIMTYIKRSNRTTEEISKYVEPHFGHDLKTIAESTVSDTNLLHHKPMAILVEGSTASSSEIVSAALIDNERALLVGEKTFGKDLAFITTSFGQSELQITVQEIKSPRGTDWGGTGLTPHVVIKQSRDTSVDVQLMKAIEVLKRDARK
jgi:carboxyl-terminal processing protease